jgi:hypothetical protein
MFQNYEHSTIESNANAGEIADERGSANHTKSNTAAIAECGLQAKRVSDRGGGRAVESRLRESEVATVLGMLLRSYWRIDTDCARQSFVSCAGHRSISDKGGCTSIALRAAVPASIPCTVPSYARCDRCKDQGLTSS